MDIYWPKDLLPGYSEKSNAMVDISNVLDAQAKGLAERTRDLVHARIGYELVENVHIWSFSIWPRLRESASYEILRVRCPSGQYPAVLETYHLPDEHRFQEVRSVRELKAALKFSLRAPRAVGVVRAMAGDALPEETTELSQDEREAARSIMVDDLVEDGATIYAEMDIFGVKVYVNDESLRAILGRPNSRNAALTKAGANFVLNLNLLGECLKVTLTETETKILQDNVAKVLGTSPN